MNYKSLIITLLLLFPFIVIAATATATGTGNGKTEAKAQSRAISYAKSSANSRCGKSNWTHLGLDIVKSKYHSGSEIWTVKAKLGYKCN